MTDSNNPPVGGTAEPLTIRGAVNQLISERKDQEPAQPTTLSPQAPADEAPADEAPDPADLEALEAEGEPEPSQPEQPRVRLQDGYEATLDEVAEWRRSGLRQSDYTRKTQELAEHRRQVAAQWQQFQANTQQYAQTIDAAIAAVSTFMPPPPSEELRKQDFFAWQERKAEYDAQVGKLQGLQQQRMQLARVEQYKQQQHQAHALVREQQALLTRRPDLRDPVKAAKYTEEVKRYAVEKGYRPEDAAQIRDHRLLDVIDDGMKWRKLMASKARLADKAKDAQPMPPVQSPSRRQSSAERTSAQIAPLKQAFEKSAEFGRSHAIRDAARLLAAERAASLKR